MKTERVAAAVRNLIENFDEHEAKGYALIITEKTIKPLRMALAELETPEPTIEPYALHVPELTPEERGMIKPGERIKAIKVIRARTGCSLGEALTAVNAVLNARDR